MQFSFLKYFHTKFRLIKISRATQCRGLQLTKWQYCMNCAIWIKEAVVESKNYEDKEERQQLTLDMKKSRLLKEGSHTEVCLKYISSSVELFEYNFPLIFKTRRKYGVLDWTVGNALQATRGRTPKSWIRMWDKLESCLLNPQTIRTCVSRYLFSML